MGFVSILDSVGTGLDVIAVSVDKDLEGPDVTP